eukprot:199935-Pyramimonas_sp.AAC.1
MAPPRKPRSARRARGSVFARGGIRRSECASGEARNAEQQCFEPKCDAGSPVILLGPLPLS